MRWRSSSWVSVCRSRLLGVFRRTTQPGLHLTKFCPGGNHVSLKHLGDRVAPLSTTDSHTTRCVWWSPPPPAPPASLTGLGLFHSTLWSCSKCLCYEQKKILFPPEKPQRNILKFECSTSGHGGRVSHDALCFVRNIEPWSFVHFLCVHFVQRFPK